jgi:hypothetical protein
VLGAPKVPDLSVFEPFRGARCLFWPDNDEVGRQLLDAVGRLLTTEGISLEVITWPGAPPKGDAADFQAAGGTHQQALELLSRAEPWNGKVDARARVEVNDEPPRHLFREIDPPRPFPVTALGKELARTAQAIERLTRAHVSVCGNSVLAAANAAIHQHVDVLLPTGERKPASEYFATVAECALR